MMDPESPVYDWFDPANTIYSERTITTAIDPNDEEKMKKHPNGIDNLRPDRIIMRPDGQILVIDYKSGDLNEKEDLRKLNRYLAKLRLIFPDAPIAGRLWYTTHDLIIPTSIE